MASIDVKIIADSISAGGERITTYELEYPRFIHSEMLTHRLFSRNAASSRAIPIARLIELVETDPAIPVHWGKNRAGMQAVEELSADEKQLATSGWEEAASNAIAVAKKLSEIGLHKQIVNRILEPFQKIKVIVTATEYENFFWLRDHKDAQPEIAVLAKMMVDARLSSTPVMLAADEWHVPYYREGFWKAGAFEEGLLDALAISASCCAQVSYRKLDDSLEKARDIFQKLIGADRKHASPFEHQATPMAFNKWTQEVAGAGLRWPDGTTHVTIDGALWSGNFKGWVQHRQLIPNHVHN